MNKISVFTKRSSLADVSQLTLIQFLIFAVSLLVLITPLQSNGAVVSLSPADIQGFTEISATGSPVTINTGQSSTGASFTTVWGFAINGPNSADIGLTGLCYDWTGFDTFSLKITNVDESLWSFSTSVSDGVTTVTSASQSLLPNIASVFTTFNVDISTLDVTGITAVFLTVSENLPIHGIDRTAEYVIATVPVPATTWLFSSALALLMWVRTRQHPSVMRGDTTTQTNASTGK